MTADPKDMLERAFSSELGPLMALSHIVLVNNEITNRFIEKTYDMPVQAWSSLYAVVHFPGLLARDIRVLFPRPQNSISRAVALLQDRGLIRDAPMKGDSRAKHLYATEAGQALLSEIEARISLRQGEIFGTLSESERCELLRLCRKVIKSDTLRQAASLD
ncbi:hypothetical protein P775_23150 [Puniceibacterium antarcticum]|uniref:HTH marR-type domain-containing protein n=1 Tax=Puniceibacterium antarcticum TaxID=1206336 RepID=A0A2G8R8C1_9RHOB|nr:MarR family winged helix-turn-helix transcriptional regulator [Puniceibacterium antarcticum]PIL17787.1 hypothetical protein P775_23150 [Puniceibacterium antarcticum]